MIKRFFTSKKSSITVILNRDAIIVDIISDIIELKFEKIDVLGKNWFDIFIAPADRAKVMEVFTGLLNGEHEKWHTHRHDIKSQDGKHLFLDFENDIFIENGETYILSKGVLHYDNRAI
jgi:hypothetical protein